MGSTADYKASTTINEITSRSARSTDRTLTFFNPSTTRTTISTNRPTIVSEQWRTTTTTRGSVTYTSPTYPESTPNSTLIIIVLVIVISFCVISVFIQYRRAKQQQSARNLSNAALMATQGMASPFSSVTVNDQMPDYDAGMMGPTAPRVLLPQLIRPFTQEDDSPPPNYVTPDVNALPFTLPPPPTYEEAISSQPKEFI